MFCKFALIEETLASVKFTIIFEPKIVEQKALKNLLVYFWSSELKKRRSFLYKPPALKWKQIFLLRRLILVYFFPCLTSI